MEYISAMRLPQPLNLINSILWWHAGNLLLRVVHTWTGKGNQCEAEVLTPPEHGCPPSRNTVARDIWRSFRLYNRPILFLPRMTRGWFLISSMLTCSPYNS